MYFYTIYICKSKQRFARTVSPNLSRTKTIFKCIHLYNICNCFSVLYFLRPLHITEKENFTEIFH